MKFLSASEPTKAFADKGCDTSDHALHLAVSTPTPAPRSPSIASPAYDTEFLLTSPTASPSPSQSAYVISTPSSITSPYTPPPITLEGPRNRHTPLRANSDDEWDLLRSTLTRQRAYSRPEC
jgi:hypothetical protein